MHTDTYPLLRAAVVSHRIPEKDTMTKIGIIPGSTRQNRLSPQVAAWVKEFADARGTEEYEIVDLRDYNLPLYDEPLPAALSEDYQTPQARAWSEKIASLDGFIFITPEYNRGIPNTLKNAIDYLYSEFANKPAGILSYGSSGGQIAVAALRVALSTLQVATVQGQPSLNLYTDFKDFSEFTPGDHHAESVNELIDQVALWARAFNTIR